MSHRLTFGWFLKFAIIIFCTTFLVTVGLIRAANAQELAPTTSTTAKVDYGPPPGPAGADCNVVWVDPPFAAQVTGVIKIDAVTFPPRTVSYDGNTTHRANFPWTTAQKFILNHPGPHTWTLTATWNIGTGSSTFTGTVTCVEPPTTTTLPPTTTTVPQTSSTTVVPPHDTDHAVPPAPQSPPQSCDATPTPAGCLPHTGSESKGLSIAALVLLGAGGAVVLGTRRRAAR